jgi:hypothetical protein
VRVHASYVIDPMMLYADGHTHEHGTEQHRARRRHSGKLLLQGPARGQTSSSVGTYAPRTSPVRRHTNDPYFVAEGLVHAHIGWNLLASEALRGDTQMRLTSSGIRWYSGNTAGMPSALL